VFDRHRQSFLLVTDHQQQRVGKMGVGTGPEQPTRLLMDTVSAQRGHFLYESGDHGDLWLDLDGLLGDARAMRDWAAALASQAAGCRPDIVCSPLTGGAFVA
jgi:orotate phosphoribosyltransferase